MKVIGISDGSSFGREYICTVTHRELEKFLGLYYDKLKALEVGGEIDLGKGYDHAIEIATAMRTTQDLIKAHQPVVSAILNGLRIQSLVAEQERTCSPA